MVQRAPAACTAAQRPLLMRHFPGSRSRQQQEWTRPQRGTYRVAEGPRRTHLASRHAAGRAAQRLAHAPQGAQAVVGRRHAGSTCRVAAQAALLVGALLLCKAKAWRWQGQHH